VVVCSEVVYSVVVCSVVVCSVVQNKQIVKTICDSMNLTRIPKEVFLPD